MPVGITNHRQMRFSYKRQRLITPYLLGLWVLFSLISACLPGQAGASEISHFAQSAHPACINPATMNRAAPANHIFAASSCTSDIDTCCIDFCPHCNAPDLALTDFQADSGKHLQAFLPVRSYWIIFLPIIQAGIPTLPATPPRHLQVSTLQLRLLI